jgi:hypothetical protein
MPTIFRHHVDERVISDMALTTVLSDRVPSLKPLVPAFLGILAIDGQSRAIITEDASEGGQYGVEQEVRLPEGIESELFDAFAWAGSPNEVFDISTLRRNMAFNVNGRTRILDLTPPPFNFQFRKWPEYREAFNAIDARLEDVTLTIGADSVLATSIDVLSV